MARVVERLDEEGIHVRGDPPVLRGGGRRRRGRGGAGAHRAAAAGGGGGRGEGGRRRERERGRGEAARPGRLPLSLPSPLLRFPIPKRLRPPADGERGRGVARGKTREKKKKKDRFAAAARLLIFDAREVPFDSGSVSGSRGTAVTVRVGSDDRK